MLPLILLVLSVLAQHRLFHKKKRIFVDLQRTFAEEPEAIVGGDDAVPGEFPHQVSLRSLGEHVCGGSIIGPKTILTAAHCVVGIAFPPFYLTFKVATGAISVDGGQLHKVAKVVAHPEYSERIEDAWKNDIAVITLKEPIEFNQYQSPIALTKSPPIAGQQCTLSGWGLTKTNGPVPDTLQKMNQVVVEQSKCQQTHSTMPLTDGHMCTLNSYGIGACQGDSGGQLISNGEQVGVTSWVLPCAKSVPDVYTSVYSYLDFIHQVSKDA